MAQQVRYHVGEQYAAALLHPLLGSLRELEMRSRHYVDHLPLAQEDLEVMQQVHEALAHASRELDRLRRASRPTT